MISKEEKRKYKQFKENIKKEKRWILSWQLLIFIIFFIGWEFSSRLYIVDPLLFSSPSRVIQLIYTRFVNGEMLQHISVTLLETIIGFLLGTVFGILFATCLWASKRTSRIADPYLVILNAMPKVALGPIIIVLFGPSYLSIVVMGAMVSVIITTLVVYTSFKEVDDNYIKVLLSFGASKQQIFTKAIFPASLPSIISTFKVNVGLSWVGVIVGEFLVSKQGLGYLIIYGFQVFDFSLVMSSLLLIAIFAALMYKGVEQLEKWLIKKTN